MRKYGLIGNPVGHSASKQLFDNKFASGGMGKYCYELYELSDASHLHDWARQEQLSGFNITLPYKETAFQQADWLSPEAREIGAINVIDVDEKSGTLRGYNTDAPAFEQTLRPLLQPWHTSALILGTGGAAKAVAYALRKLGIDYLMVSRQPKRGQSISYLQAEQEARKRFLIVNATPVGMSPNEALTPWTDIHILSARHLCYDLVYNPEETRFLLEAELVGATVKNGKEMLHLQAELSWKIWNIQ